TVRPLVVDVPRERLTAVTGVSGSGKTTLVLESLVPALRAAGTAESGGVGAPPPAHVTAIDPAGITRAQLVDATPIGVNVRSTIATYRGVMDDLRLAYATPPQARERGLGAGDLSYRAGSLRCPRCDGTGQARLDLQFLPDVDITCPD